MYKTVTICLVLQSLLSQAWCQNRPSPVALPSYRFDRIDTTYIGHYFLTPISFQDFSGNNGLALLLDKDGYIAWYMQSSKNLTDFGFNPTCQKYSYIQSSNWMVKYLIMDKNFVHIDSVTLPRNLADAHEFHILDNGNLLLSGAKDSIVDLSAHVFSGVQGSDTTHIIAFTIEEYDSIGNRIFYWNSNDHLNPLESYFNHYGYDSARFDYCHGNAIDKTSDGGYLVSFRHTNSIYKIDANGNTLWRLGGKNSTFTFVGDSGFSGQHDVRELPNGNITLFDNGNMMDSPKVSRAVEYMLDTNSWTATKIWEYTHSSAPYAFAMGNYRRSNEEYHSLGYGFIQRPYPSAIFTHPNGDLISAIYLKDSVYSYRARPIELSYSLPRFTLSCDESGGLFYLEAPAGFDRYIWNTGDTSKKIWVTDTGTYQCWVNHSAGMIGSLPYFVDDSLTCQPNGDHSVRFSQTKNIEAIFDLEGKITRRISLDAMYIVQFSSGHCKKMMGYQILHHRSKLPISLW